MVTHTEPRKNFKYGDFVVITSGAFENQIIALIAFISLIAFTALKGILNKVIKNCKVGKTRD
jgi:hypothetical protein